MFLIHSPSARRDAAALPIHLRTSSKRCRAEYRLPPHSKMAGAASRSPPSRRQRLGVRWQAVFRATPLFADASEPRRFRKINMDADWPSGVSCAVSTWVRFVIRRLRCKHHMRLASIYPDRPSAPCAISGVQAAPCLSVCVRTRTGRPLRLFRAAPPPPPA